MGVRVGAGEVAHQADPADGGAVGEARVGGGCGLGPEAEASHAGVDLQPGGERPVEAGRLEHAELARLVHRDLEAVASAERKLGCLEDALEQKDRLRRAGLADDKSLLDAGDAQHVGVTQGREEADGAMAVAVRFYHGDDAAPAGEAAGLGQVMPEGGEVDGGGGGPHCCQLSAQKVPA